MDGQRTRYTAVSQVSMRPGILSGFFIKLGPRSPGFLLVLMILVAACSAPTAQGEPTAAAGAVKGAKYRIAGIVFLENNIFMQTVQAGMKAYANEQGGIDLILSSTENDLARESRMIDDLIAQKVDAIVITPLSADGSVAALRKAKQAGITIICFNTCIDQAGIASAFLATQNEDLGRKTGEAAATFIPKRMGGPTKIGILNCDEFPVCQLRKKQFLAQVARLPAVEVVADQPGWIADNAWQASAAMLQTHSEINLLWAANEGGTVGHVMAVKSTGRQGRVFVFGTDMSDQMARMLLSSQDILQGVTGQAPYQMGYDALKTAFHVLNGESVQYQQNAPTIFFGRGHIELIKRFLETGGETIFGSQW